ncbi:hypothetical protein [Coleofasciculus sp. FACHB-1120]|uniref:hypothetical protein n=1 Tax=Coleofasciculus sp. FACHB-1120 TaxID=2692783 RepID=UPI0016866F85|nr:hypothetical protein [Coleofasciculus sp. FACHB-1120]MBD2740193.1 hypothetical protein [Coleofasciculus sp. FACHB-1120]
MLKERERQTEVYQVLFDRVIKITTNTRMQYRDRETAIAKWSSKYLLALHHL